MTSPDRPFEHPAWTTLSSRLVVDSPHLRLRADTIELPGGKVVTDYFVQDTRGYSVIFPITREGRIVLVRQYKHGLGKVILELPAGAIDPHEDPLSCAARELAEETGYVGDPPEFIASFATNPTGSNGRFYLYLVRNAVLSVAQHLDETEHIEVLDVDFATLLDLAREGAIETNTHITAIFTIFDRARRGKLSLAPATLPTE